MFAGPEGACKVPPDRPVNRSDQKATDRETIGWLLCLPGTAAVPRRGNQPGLQNHLLRRKYQNMPVGTNTQLVNIRASSQRLS